MKLSSRMRSKFKLLKYIDIIYRKLLMTIKVKSCLNHLRCNITFQQLRIDHLLLYYFKDNILLVYTYLIQYIVATKYSINAPYYLYQIDAVLLDRYSLQIRNEGLCYIGKNKRRLQKLTFKQL